MKCVCVEAVVVVGVEGQLYGVGDWRTSRASSVRTVGGYQDGGRRVLSGAWDREVTWSLPILEWSIWWSVAS